MAAVAPLDLDDESMKNPRQGHLDLSVFQTRR
jgi:hypothetical protein